MRRLATVAAAVALLFAATGCEPKMTITAKDVNKTDACGLRMYVEGKVTPATATSRVVLQQTTGGKWVDVKGWADQNDVYSKPASARAAAVASTTGEYSIVYVVDWHGIKHLRVRSSGSGAVSPGFYVNITGDDGC